VDAPVGLLSDLPYLTIVLSLSVPVPDSSYDSDVVSFLLFFPCAYAFYRPALSRIQIFFIFFFVSTLDGRLGG